MKRIVLLGSTGSIGASTLDVVRGLDGEFRIVGLACRGNVAPLCRQAEELGITAVAIADAAAAARAGSSVPRGALIGPDAPERLVRETDADIVVAAMAGAAGLPPVLAALDTGKDVALANKETLVMAGAIVMERAARQGRRILPVDSEHSAIFQSMQGSAAEEVDRIILTASGGALRDVPPDRWPDVTPAQALAHPNWNMGPKITIDSASLMNKALEIIEAHWLFGLPPDRIEVLIHPQSIVHSMVQFCDGSVIAQMGPPDMRFAIQYALTWPERLPSSFPRMNLDLTGSLSFRKPQGYRTLDLAFEVLRLGGAAGAVFNAANETAVEAFLQGRIKFTDITDIVAETLTRGRAAPAPDLAELMRQDAWARDTALALAARSR